MTVSLIICFTALLCTALVTGAWQKIRLAQCEMIKTVNAASVEQAQKLAAGMTGRN